LREESAFPNTLEGGIGHVLRRERVRQVRVEPHLEEVHLPRQQSPRNRQFRSIFRLQTPRGRCLIATRPSQRGR
jgi:hypothetical protein